MNKLFKLFMLLFIGVTVFVFLLPFFQVYANTNYSIVRVLISISKPVIPIVLDGEYMILEDPSLNLPRGEYSVSISKDNAVQLNGMGIDVVIGPSLTFVRLKNDSGGNNHLRIIGTLHGDINYLGDMKFTINSGNLRVVNHVPLEHYLYGVVPHEMSDSFPLEALKAQAVSARGYAANYIRTTGTHDLGDTTTHQVYKGFNPIHTRAIQAVNETAGQVLTHNGRIISTFYSASNGGQTEVPGNTWGGGAAKNAEFPYLVQKDDPYDLSNPSSLFHRFFVPREVLGTNYGPVSIPGEFAVRIVKTNGNINIRSGPSTVDPVVGSAPLNSVFEWLETLDEWNKIRYNGNEAYISTLYSTKVDNGRYLYPSPVLADMQKKAFDVLKASGIEIGNANEVLVTKVNSLTNGIERWPGTGSRSYVTANSNVSVKYHVNGSEDLSEEVNLDIVLTLMEPSGNEYQIFHEYISSNTRMRGVGEVDNGFFINAGRYGHGVGMSQRGAQQMASAHNMTYKEILAFYFEGTSLTTINTTIPELPAKPEPEPEPEPKEPSLSTNKYKIQNGYISGLTTSSKVSSFISNLTIEDGVVEIVSGSGKVKGPNDIVGTGDVLKLKWLEKDEVLEKFTIIIYGDVVGDGQITPLDLLQMRRHLLDITKLRGPSLVAADINKDGSITPLDLLAMRRHFLDIEKIKQ